MEQPCWVLLPASASTSAIPLQPWVPQGDVSSPGEISPPPHCWHKDNRKEKGFSAPIPFWG